MKAKFSFFLVVASVISITSCNQVSYKKAKSGMIYKIIPGGGKDSLIKDGYAVKFQFVQMFNDSVMNDSYKGGETMPGYVRAETSPNTEYTLMEILPQMRKGDSGVVIAYVDTLLRKGAQLWPGVKKGDRLITYFRIIDVFKTDSLAQADYDKERERAMTAMQEKEKKLGEGQIAEIEKYLKDKNIQAVKTKSGAFVETIREGSGPVIDSGKYVSVMYTGTLFDGEKFDSNVDTAFGHTQPLEFIAGNFGKPRGMIQGFDEGVMMMKKGGKARFYLPSHLGYGSNPRPGGPIKPNDKLIFDVEVMDVKDTAPASPMPMGH